MKKLLTILILLFAFTSQAQQKGKKSFPTDYIRTPERGNMLQTLRDSIKILKQKMNSDSSDFAQRVRLNVVSLPSITLTQTATVAISSGVRKITAPCVGLNAGDRILLTPTTAPASGYAIAQAICTTDDTMDIWLTAPSLAIGASYSITCKVTVFR